MDYQSRKLGLHPLTIATICDHYTRISVGGSIQQAGTPALGLLFGLDDPVKGIEICDAVDLLNTPAGMEFPFADVERKSRLLIEVFPKYKLLGWYTTGSHIASHHYTIHKHLSRYSPNLLFLLLNPVTTAESSQLPITLFSITNQSGQFTEIPFSLSTNRAEEISIDSITKQASTGGSSISRLEIQSKGMATSLRVLEEHIEVLLTEAKKMSDSGVVNHQLLRKLGSLTNQLAILSKEGANRDTTESEITSYLGASTKALLDLHHLLDVTSVTCHEKSF